MGLERLGLLFLINYFNQLGSVKNHLLLALREVMLAIQASVDIVAQSAPKSLLGGKMELLNPLVEQINGVLNFTITKLTPSEEGPGSKALPEEDQARLKEHIVNSIISAIDDEIENTRGTLSEKGKLKIEALHTVKHVLLNQRSKTVQSSKAASVSYSSERVRKTA